MSNTTETQDSLFAPGDFVAEPAQEGPSAFNELRQPTRRFLARTAVAGIEPQELEGMPQTPQDPNRELERLPKRAALSPAMRPEYWDIDEAKFAEVSEEDYELSSPRNLSVWLHKHTDQSLRQTGPRSAWVLLTPQEKTAILNIPFEYAAGAEAKYRTKNAATFKPHDVVQQEAVEEGAKALEARLAGMQNLAMGYELKVENLRALTKMLKQPWMANAPSGIMVKEAATTLREGLRELVSNIAKVDNWSEKKLERTLIGLDMRLTAGDTRKREQEKTAEWRQLTRLFGNYLLAKIVLAQDRLAKCHEEIYKRRNIVLK